jgi:hypothetical protein
VAVVTDPSSSLLPERVAPGKGLPSGPPVWKDVIDDQIPERFSLEYFVGATTAGR